MFQRMALGLLLLAPLPVLAANSLTPQPVPAPAAPPTAPPAAQPMFKPSFDCAAAKAKVKLLICGDADLSALDVREAALLRRALAKASEPDAVRADEDVWLHQRDACSSAACLSRAYVRRIADLHQWTD